MVFHSVDIEKASLWNARLAEGVNALAALGVVGHKPCRTQRDDSWGGGNSGGWVLLQSFIKLLGGNQVGGEGDLAGTRNVTSHGWTKKARGSNGSESHDVQEEKEYLSGHQLASVKRGVWSWDFGVRRNSCDKLINKSGLSASFPFQSFAIVNIITLVLGVRVLSQP